MILRPPPLIKRLPLTVEECALLESVRPLLRHSRRRGQITYSPSWRDLDTLVRNGVINPWQAAVPSFVSVGAFQNGLGALNVPWGSGHAADDIGILVLSTDRTDAISVSSPAGWNAIGTPQDSASAANDSRLSLFWKRAVGASETNVATTDSGDHQAGQIFVYRGCVTSGDPWESLTQNAGASSTSGVITGGTSTGADRLVVVVIGHGADNQNGVDFFTDWANGDLANVTQRDDRSSNSGTGSGYGVADGEKAAAGTYGDTTVTLAVASPFPFFSFALIPAAAATGALLKRLLLG